MSSPINITLPARLEYLNQFIEAVSTCAVEKGLSDKKRLAEIQLAVEETLVNVFNYAYADREGEVEVICNTEGGDLIIEIVDSGIPFNPLAYGEPDVTADVAERKIGGLGVFLIRKVMDDVRYQRVADKNILDLVVHLGSAP
jgi:serine/threonine-protein kinase RsbW